MAQHDGSRKGQSRPAEKKPSEGRVAQGGGEKGRGGEQYQAREMGAHPASGEKGSHSAGQEEDYGSRALHRQAGTTKREGFEERGIGHAEDYDARYGENEFKGKDEARRGRKVMVNQTVGERDATSRHPRPKDAKSPPRGAGEVSHDSGGERGDLDISPGAAGGSKHSKRDPASR